MKIYQCEEGEEEVGAQNLFGNAIQKSQKIVKGEEKDERWKPAARRDEDASEDAEEEEPEAGDEGGREEEEERGGGRVCHAAWTFYSW